MYITTYHLLLIIVTATTKVFIFLILAMPLEWCSFKTRRECKHVLKLSFCHIVGKANNKDRSDTFQLSCNAAITSCCTRKKTRWRGAGKRMDAWVECGRKWQRPGRFTRHGEIDNGEKKEKKESCRNRKTERRRRSQAASVFTLFVSPTMSIDATRYNDPRSMSRTICFHRETNTTL